MSDSEEENIDITDEEIEEVTVQSESVHYRSSASSQLTAETLGIGMQQMHEDTAKRERLAQQDKRAHHNALERKRRDHIKDSFISLRDAIPTLQGEKVSRAQILKKAGDYIDFMMRKNQTTRATLDNLRSQNRGLENQLLRLERTHNAGRFVQQQQQRAASSSSEESASAGAANSPSDTSSSSGRSAEADETVETCGPTRSKRLRVER